VIWRRTPAGEAELKTHAAGLRAAAQNVLMILDGVKTEQMLLTNLAGVTREDFRALIQLGLIEPVDPGVATSSSSGAGEQPSTGPAPETRFDKRFAEVLAAVINTHLGLAGFRLRTACEKASTTAELHDLARMAIALIAQRKGPEASQEARLRLERSATNFRSDG
jgi:hypothetical protein